jgi:hypothetical protein
MIKVSDSGSFKNSMSWLESMSKNRMFEDLDRLAREAANLLSSATPKDTGRAASDWDYEIKKGKGAVSIHWTNDDIESGVNVVILLQYGHGTGTGGYVSGRDFINPVMRPQFDKITDAVWKRVTE